MLGGFDNIKNLKFHSYVELGHWIKEGLLKFDIVKKQKSNGVNFKDFVGFIQWFMNRVPSRLADRKKLQGTVQNERLLGRKEWAQGS